MRSISQLLDLTGRRALIAGGGGHIGFAAAEALVELGAAVALVDVDEGACLKTADRLCELRPRSAVAIPSDLSDEVGARRAVRSALRGLGGLEILIHCAAFVGTTGFPGWAVPFEQQTVEAWDAALRVNLTSAFVMAQEAKPSLESSGKGSVVLVSSIYGTVAPDFELYRGTAIANPVAYGASKGGLLQLMRYLATIFAPHIRVNAISPGGVWRNQPEIFHDRYVRHTPLRRMATEEDLKGAFAYLASDLSAYVTGHNLVVDGGWTTW